MARVQATEEAIRAACEKHRTHLVCFPQTVPFGMGVVVMWTPRVVPRD